MQLLCELLTLAKELRSAQLLDANSRAVAATQIGDSLVRLAAQEHEGSLCDAVATAARTDVADVALSEIEGETADHLGLAELAALLDDVRDRIDSNRRQAAQTISNNGMTIADLRQARTELEARLAASEEEASRCEALANDKNELADLVEQLNRRQEETNDRLRACRSERNRLRRMGEHDRSTIASLEARNAPLEAANAQLRQQLADARQEADTGHLRIADLAARIDQLEDTVVTLRPFQEELQRIRGTVPARLYSALRRRLAGLAPPGDDGEPS